MLGSVTKNRPDIAFDDIRGTRQFDGYVRSVRPGAVDHFFERDIFFALGAADQAHLLEIVLGLEQVALFGVPHAVIRPRQSVFRIGGERLVVPILGVVLAAELAARIAKQRRDVGIVVMGQCAQCGDAALVIVLVVDQGISRMIAIDEILRRAALVVFLLLLARFAVGRLAALRAPACVTGGGAAHRSGKLRGARDGRRKNDGCKHRSFTHGSSGFGCLVPWSLNERAYPGVLTL